MLFGLFEVGIGLVEFSLESIHGAKGALVVFLLVDKVVCQEVDDQLADADGHDDASNVRCRHGCWCIVSG